MLRDDEYPVSFPDQRPRDRAKRRNDGHSYPHGERHEDLCGAPARDYGTRHDFSRGRGGARARRRTRARCVPGSDSARLRYDDLRAPRAHRGAPGEVGQRDLGHRQGVWHDWGAPRRPDRRGDDVSHRRVRDRLAQAGGDLRRHARRRPDAPRLHGQCDGDAPAADGPRRPVRRPGRPRGWQPAHPRVRRAVLRRRPAAHHARRAFLGAAGPRRRHGRHERDGYHGLAPGDRLRRAHPRRA